MQVKSNSQSRQTRVCSATDWLYGPPAVNHSVTETTKLLFHQSPIQHSDYMVTGQWQCSHHWQLPAARWLHSWFLVFRKKTSVLLKTCAARIIFYRNPARYYSIIFRAQFIESIVWYGIIRVVLWSGYVISLIWGEKRCVSEMFDINVFVLWGKWNSMFPKFCGIKYLWTIFMTGQRQSSSERTYFWRIDHIEALIENVPWL